jgi:hypothetical protein
LSSRIRKRDVWSLQIQELSIGGDSMEFWISEFANSPLVVQVALVNQLLSAWPQPD